MNKELKAAMEQARKYAADFRIRHSGVTVDFCNVTTLECVEYQRKNGTLLLHYDGNWRMKRTPRTTGWVKGRTRVTRYLPFPKEEVSHGK